MKIFKETNIQFVKYIKMAISISTICILIGIISVVFFRGLNYGIDFTGGTLIQVQFDHNVTTAEIRNALATVNLENSMIQKSVGMNEYIIRIAQDNSTENIPAQISTGLNTLKETTYEIRRTEQVGPKIGKELRTATVWAIIWALVVIGIYISIRFQFRFAIGAVVALIHDVLFTLGVFSVTHLEISLTTIAAFLTIVGYSLNDTIVIYDRVRENMKIMRSENITTIVNRSINETLSRTIITAFTTFIVVLVLSFTSGEIQVFAIAMMIGVIVGTYSSIYIAGPIVISLQSTRHAKKQ
jgi:preprotein translocase subunit SecF